MAQRGEIKCLNHIMGYCVTQGEYARKSNLLTVDRTREFLGITRSYARGFESRILFVYLALFLGYALRPVGFFWKNYYLWIMKTIGKSHELAYREDAGIML